MCMHVSAVSMSMNVYAYFVQPKMLFEIKGTKLILSAVVTSERHPQITFESKKSPTRIYGD